MDQTGRTGEIFEKGTQDRRTLVLGKRIKVLKGGEVI